VNGRPVTPANGAITLPPGPATIRWGPAR
jgi:hypothetical protein